MHERRAIMDLNYKVLRTGDYVLTTSLYLLADTIRYRTSGKIFDLSIPTHAGMIVDIYGKYFIAEMKQTLQINSIKRCYLNQGYLGCRIVNIRRNSVFDDPEKRYNLNQQIISDYFETISYDYKGILSYIFSKIPQDPTRYYCSEYCQKYAVEFGKPITDKLKCSPYDIQVSERLQDVKGWQIE